jgi:hypothetical protein
MPRRLRGRKSLCPSSVVGVGGVMVLGGGIMFVQPAVRACSGGGSGRSVGEPTFESTSVAQVQQAPGATSITEIKLGADSIIAL